jgi:hypothetical protein
MSDLAIYELITDDSDRFGLYVGDLLLCVPYHLDPDKVTVICRITDGFEPNCNQYRQDVRKVEFKDGDGGFWAKHWDARQKMLANQPVGDAGPVAEYRYWDGTDWEICTEKEAKHFHGWTSSVSQQEYRSEQRTVGAWQPLVVTS